MAGAQGASVTGKCADPALMESARKRTKKLGNGHPVVESSGWRTLGASGTVVVRFDTGGRPGSWRAGLPGLYDHGGQRG